jgi:response regulator of citrate/malate metabolism
MGVLGTAELSQAEVDTLRAGEHAARRWLPKGLTEPALERVRTTLDQAEGPVTAAYVADAVGMARVTVRRYLEYLVATQQADCRSEASGPGRPRKLYWSDVMLR